MKNYSLVPLALLTLLSLVGTTLPARAQQTTVFSETPAQHDARMQWWRKAKFGLFIHWGVYSVPAGYYKGKPVGGLGEWIMNDASIPTSDYKEFAHSFNPVKYNPDEWVRTAKEAGMQYIVITSKHHDGFALFDSKASDWNVVKATPYGKDLLKPLAAACKKYGIKLGFYYSQAQDWNNPGGGAYKAKWDKTQEGSFDDYLTNVALPQMREILSNYGPVSVVWFDTPAEMTSERAARFLPVLRLQPGLIINNRLGGDINGDTETPEQYIPGTGFPGRDWESCMTMNDTWGFKRDDNNWKSSESLIRNLVDIASKGGNYLLNVGPTSEGLIPEPSIDRLKTIGKWMKVNHEAIYSTSASPFRSLPWGRCTTQANGTDTTLYIHVFNWPTDGQLRVPGLTNTVSSAYILDGKKTVTATNTADSVVLSLPTTAPDTISSTIVLKIKGKPVVAPVFLNQEANGNLTLAARDAITTGSHLQYESNSEKENLGYWTDSSDWAQWQVDIKKPGKFRVVMEVATEQGDGNFEISTGDQKLRGTAPKTGGYSTFQTIEVGTLEITNSGHTSIAIHPIAEGWQPINLKSIQLIAVP